MGTAARRELLAKCEELIKSFDPKKTTLDSHPINQKGDHELAGASDENLFIKQVLYGVVRHKNPLKSFMSCFFNDMSVSVLRSDYTLYMILAFLIVFRLKELTFAEFRKFALAIDPDKMINFLGYIFDVERLKRNGVVREWLKTFDLEHVERQLLANLVAFRPEVAGLVADLQAKALGLAAAKEAAEAAKGVAKLASKAPTIPIAPNLTKPAPRKVKEPMRIAQEVQVGADPTYLDKTSLAEIDAEKKARLAEQRTATLAKYAESKVQPFQLHETKENVHRLRREVEAREAAELSFDMPKRREVPPRPDAAVKLNTAAVLREDALYKAKQQKEAKQIAAYEAELRDCTEFYMWQTDMREKDLAIRREQVERTRHLAKASAIEALNAVEKQRDDNRKLADAIKHEGAAMGKQRKLEEDLKTMVNQQLVREVAHVRSHAPHEAKAAVLEQRKQRRASVRAEIDELLVAKAAEEAREQEAMEDRVKQLKALHHVHRQDPKVFNPTESAGLGLLDEMSLVEMHERHAINKVREGEQQESKRDEINSAKAAKQHDLARRIANIKRVREAAATSNREARERHVSAHAMHEARHKVERETKMLSLVDELDGARNRRHAEKSQLQEEADRRKKAQGFLGQGKHMVEEMHFEQLLKGAEREALDRQQVAQEATRVYEATKAHERKMVETLGAKKEAGKRRLYAAKAEELHKATQEVTVQQKEEIAAKKDMFLAQRERQKRVKDRVIGHNPYADKINQMSITTAQTHAAKTAAAAENTLFGPGSTLSMM